MLYADENLAIIKGSLNSELLFQQDDAFRTRRTNINSGSGCYFVLRALQLEMQLLPLPNSSLVKLCV